MLIVVSGPSGIGKSFSVDYFRQYHGFTTLTPYTTRNPRPSESEGIHYHFRSEKDLRELSANFSMGYWARPFENIWYGYTKDVDKLGKDQKNWIIQAYSDLAIQMKKSNPEIHIVFLDYISDKMMMGRIKERFGSNEESLKARLQHADHERGNKKKFDFIIESDNPEEIVRNLETYTFPFVVQTPQSSACLPGPLSDTDISTSLKAPDGIKIEGITADELNKRIHGWSIDLTLSSKYFRITKPKITERVFDLLRGNETDTMKRFIESITPDNEGIYLKQNEFILGSTKEKIFLPPNIVCLISGRSSYSRIGISVELSQMILQPGHNDTIPLQIKNNLPYPIIVYPSTPLVQAIFFRTISTCTTPYPENSTSKYLGTLDDIRSKYYVDSVYQNIRNIKPLVKVIDLSYVVNIFLLILFIALIIFSLATRFSIEENKNMSDNIKSIIDMLLIIVAIIGGLRLFKKI